MGTKLTGKYLYLLKILMLASFLAEAKPVFCVQALAGIELNWWERLQNRLWGLKYIEQNFEVSNNDYKFVEVLLAGVKIGFDNDYTSTIPENRWHGMWSKFNGNLWDIKYSDPPALYGLAADLALAPEEKGFRIFAKKAIHRFNSPSPTAYLVAWEQLFTRHVDWAVHIVFVDGGDYWLLGKNIGGNKQYLKVGEF